MDRRNISQRLVLLAALLMTAVTASAGDLPTVDEILDRYVAALGGRENILKLETRVLTGTQIDDRPFRGPPVHAALEAWADTSGRWAMALCDSAGEHREGFDGQTNWVRQPGESVRENDYRNTKLAFLFNPQGPLQVERYFPNLRLTGTRIFEGVTYYMVENDLKYEYYTLYFEVETGLLTRIGFHWWLEDLREIDGVLVPFTIVRGRKGGSTNLVFESVKHGADVGNSFEPDALFSPGKPGFPDKNP